MANVCIQYLLPTRIHLDHCISGILFSYIFYNSYIDTRATRAETETGTETETDWLEFVSLFFRFFSHIYLFLGCKSCLPGTFYHRTCYPLTETETETEEETETETEEETGTETDWLEFVSLFFRFFSHIYLFLGCP